MPRPSHPSWLDCSNYTWRRVQVMKFLSYLEYGTINKSSEQNSSSYFYTLWSEEPFRI
jgi:hypothetical protein